MAKAKYTLILFIISTLLLSSCADDTVMHLDGEDYLHKESADEREVNVVETQLGLASLGKNLNKFNSKFATKALLSNFATSTGTLGSSTGGSDNIFQQEGYLYFPIDSGRFSSNFGWRSLGSTEFHSGIDFGVAVGTPLYASLTGTVVRDGINIDSCSSTAGCNVTIEGKLGDQKVRVSYFHLKQATGLKVGDSVTVGKKIGETGHTGRSTKPHLHIEVMIEETYTVVGMNANRPKVSSMLPPDQLKGARKQWWWDLPFSWSRVDPKSFFKETEGVTPTGQTITRTRGIMGNEVTNSGNANNSNNSPNQGGAQPTS